MREIKFRAWDKLFKKMRYNVERDGDGANRYSGAVRISVDSFHDLLTQKLVLNFENRVTTELRFIPMQYTGLKDKNGKEIYEEDIIERGDYDPRVIQTISYGYGGFCIYENGGYMPPQWDMKIIGNIYENPELSEGK